MIKESVRYYGECSFCHKVFSNDVGKIDYRNIEDLCYDMEYCGWALTCNGDDICPECVEKLFKH